MTPEQALAPVDTVSAIIDGVEVTVPKGTLIIRAAEQIGVAIPRFCDHPLLAPVGACRQCLVDVEINGRAFPKPQASCTMPVENGMIVKTQMTSAVAAKAQEGIMEFLLINHPLDCPISTRVGSVRYKIKRCLLVARRAALKGKNAPSKSQSISLHKYFLIVNGAFSVRAVLVSPKRLLEIHLSLSMSAAHCSKLVSTRTSPSSPITLATPFKSAPWEPLPALPTASVLVPLISFR
jgi:hypothetical protein